jgi:DNA polymerase-1
MLRHLRSGPTLTVDYETSGLAWFAHAHSIGIALATWDRDSGKVWNYYVPYRHRTGEHQLDFNLIAPAIKDLLADESTLKIAQNIKFEDHFTRREGWELRGPRFDTMIASHIYDENTALKLETQAKELLGREDSRYWELELQKELLRIAREEKIGVREYKRRHGYEHIPINLCGTYACFDVDHTTNLYFFYEKWGIRSRYSRIWPTEMELTTALCDMEQAGLPIDVEYLESLRGNLVRVMVGLENQIQSILGPAMFRLGSDDELRYFMRVKLGLELVKKTKGNKASVDREVLEQFQGYHPVLKLLLAWRDAEKLASTYTTSILSKLDARGVVHQDFQQVGTNTGRLACKEPNFQNQPVDSDDRAMEYSGKKLEDGGVDPWSIRRAYITRKEGSRVIPRLFFDYSQIELRTIAFYSSDPRMTQVYLEGGDIHKAVSEEVDRPRRIAKVINFGLSYGMTEMGLARQAKLDSEDAKATLERFFQRFPGIVDLRKRLWNSMVQDPEAAFSNLFGRTRRVPLIKSTEDWERGRAQRQAIGSLIQGTAAELTKESIVRIRRFLIEENLPAKLVNTVHDEVQIDCLPECLVQVVQGVKARMEDYPEFAPIPIIVDGDYTTKSWADKKPLPKSA